MDFANVGICYVDFAMPHCVFFLMIVAKYRCVFLFLVLYNSKKDSRNAKKRAKNRYQKCQQKDAKVSKKLAKRCKKVSRNRKVSSDTP